MRLSEMNSKELLPSIYQGKHDFICAAFDAIFKEMAKRTHTLRAHDTDAFLNMSESEQLQTLKDCGIDWFFADMSETSRAEFCSYVMSNLEHLCTKESLEELLRYVYDDPNIRAEIIKVRPCEYTIYIMATSHEVVAWTETIVDRVKQYVQRFWPVHVSWDGLLKVDALEMDSSLIVDPITFDGSEDVIFSARDEKPLEYYIRNISNSIRYYYFYGTNTPGAQSALLMRYLHTVQNSGAYANYVTNSGTLYRAFLIGSPTATIKHCSNYQVYAVSSGSTTNWAVQFPNDRPHDELPNGVRVLMLSYTSMPTGYGFETHDIKLHGQYDMAFSMLNNNTGDNATRYYCLLSDIDEGRFVWYSRTHLEHIGCEFLDEAVYVAFAPDYASVSFSSGTACHTAYLNKSAPVSFYNTTGSDLIEVFTASGNFVPGQYHISTNQKHGYGNIQPTPDPNWSSRVNLLCSTSVSLSSAAWGIVKSYDNSVELPNYYRIAPQASGGNWTLPVGETLLESVYDVDNALEHGTNFALPIDTFVDWRWVDIISIGEVLPFSMVESEIRNDYSTGRVTIWIKNKTDHDITVNSMELYINRYDTCLAYARSGAYQPANVTLNAGATANTYAPQQPSSPGLAYFKNYHAESMVVIQSRPIAFVNRNDVDLGVENIELVPTQWTNADHTYLRIKNISSAGISWSNVTAQLII